jgi:hypothetical protein
LILRSSYGWRDHRGIVQRRQFAGRREFSATILGLPNFQIFELSVGVFRLRARVPLGR